MKTGQSRKRSRLRYMLLLTALVITVGLVMGGAYVQEGYNITRGQVSFQRVRAPRKIENTVATQRNRATAAEAAKKMEPVMERDTIVNERVLEALEGFFDKVSLTRKNMALSAAMSQMDAQTEEALQEGQAGQTRPVSPNTNTTDASASNLVLPIYLNDHLTRLLLDMSESDFLAFKQKVLDVTASIFADGIQDVDAKGLLMVKNAVDKLDLDADTQNLCNEIVAAYIQPNIVVNEDATQLARAERSSQYETVYYLKGQTIVDEGQIISEEAYAVMEQLKLIKEDNNGANWFLITGAMLIICGLFALFCIYVGVFYPHTIYTQKEALLFFTLYVSCIAIAYLTMGLPYLFSANLVFVILVAMLFDFRIAVLTNVFLTIVSMLICKGDNAFVLYYIITGTFAACVSRYTNERNKIIMAGLLTSAVSFGAFVGVSLFFDRSYSSEMLIQALYAAAMGLVSVIVSIGSAPFWEVVFGVVTPYRLIEMANPNNPLLRRLTLEAPGTYHHSLIVANLAETAAYKIGANPALARAAGYYHDVGKLKYPNYFAENQMGQNPHDDMDPYSSVQVLISHVAFGLELAEKHRLPGVIHDIIAQHHGTTLMKFFYVKAQRMAAEKQADSQATEQDEPAETVDEKDFRYPYITPQSQEAAIVMMADTVEAALRSTISAGKSMAEVEMLVRKLVKDKLEDGQLVDSQLTIGDVETIINAFLIVFKGMHHERVPYPEDKKVETP